MIKKIKNIFQNFFRGDQSSFSFSHINLLLKAVGRPLTQGRRPSSYSKAFGLLEVLISAGILIMVLGSVVFTSRVSLKNNLIANQRAQAYNLVRGDLEILRSMRDSTWIDQIVNEWNEPFKLYINDNQKHHLDWQNDHWQINPDSIEDPLDGTKFTKELTVTNVNDSLNSELRALADNPELNQDNSSLIIIKSTVKWVSNGKTYSVTGSVNLTDWKIQI